jgi:chemotaxis protein MotB
MTPLDLVQPERSNPSARQASPVWMISFIDLVSLLVAFFVMLFALSRGSTEQWHETARPIAEYWRGTAALRAPGVLPVAPSSAAIKPPLALGYVASLIEGWRAADPVLAQIRAATRPDGISLAMPADSLLEPDGTAITAAGRLLLDHLAPRLAALSNPVEVVVHGVGSPEQSSVWRRAAGIGLLVARGLDTAGFHPGASSVSIAPIGRSGGRPERGLELIIRGTDGSPR